MADRNVDFLFEVMESGSQLREAVNNSEIVKIGILLESGQWDVNEKDAYGRTVLFVPVCRGNVYLVKLLVSHGASVKVTDNNGNNVLHWCGNPDIIEVLVSSGADIKQRNKMGFTPKEMARRRGVPTDTIDVFTHLEKDKDTQKHVSSGVLDKGQTYQSVLREFAENVGLRNLCLLIIGIFFMSLQFAYIITGASKHLEMGEPVTIAGL